MIPGGESDFLELVEILAPGRRDLVTVLQACFDESFGPSGLLCVAGYVFDKKGARGITRAWSAMLERYDLPYFRMSACAHGNHPFGALSKEARDRVAREAIALIRKHAVMGVATTVDEPEFNEIVPRPDAIGGARAYEFCAWQSLMGVRLGLEKMGFAGGVAYLFEAGHRSQSAANALMNRLFNVPELRKEYRYLSHSFVDKSVSCPVQAADVLAWQFYTDRRRQLEGKARRADTAALLIDGCPYAVRHVDAKDHADFVQRTMEKMVSEGLLA